MQKNKQLNNLVIRYKKTNKETDFNLIYRQVKKVIDRGVEVNSKKYLINTEDVRAAYEDVLQDNIRTWRSTKGNFLSYFLQSVKYRLIDISRKEEKIRNREELQEEKVDEQGNELTFFELQKDDFDTEEEAIKKEQRQLLRHLYANTDEFAQKVIEKFLELGNVGATAKSLNSNADRVNRALARLGRQYDANRFGDPSDYFTA